MMMRCRASALSLPLPLPPLSLSLSLFFSGLAGSRRCLVLLGAGDRWCLFFFGVDAGRAQGFTSRRRSPRINSTGLSQRQTVRSGQGRDLSRAGNHPYGPNGQK